MGVCSGDVVDTAIMVSGTFDGEVEHVVLPALCNLDTCLKKYARLRFYELRKDEKVYVWNSRLYW